MVPVDLTGGFIESYFEEREEKQELMNVGVLIYHSHSHQQQDRCTLLQSTTCHWSTTCHGRSKSLRPTVGLIYCLCAYSRLGETGSSSHVGRLSLDS